VDSARVKKATETTWARDTNMNERHKQDVVAAVLSLHVGAPSFVDDVVHQKSLGTEVCPSPDGTRISAAQRPNRGRDKLVDRRKRTGTTANAGLGNLHSTHDTLLPRTARKRE